LGDAIIHHPHERRSAHGMVRPTHQTYPHAQWASVRNWPTPCLEIRLKNGPLAGRVTHHSLMIPDHYRTVESAGKKPSRHKKPTVALRASVRRHRRAQGASPTLRSIRPTRAKRPFDASVDLNRSALRRITARNGTDLCFGIRPSPGRGRPGRISPLNGPGIDARGTRRGAPSRDAPGGVTQVADPRGR
jgi:hypothetical protein